MIYEKLAKVQKELKAPKGQYNSFGKYKYRSCEDILEAAKPLCANNGLVLTISDSVKLIGERFYIMATAKVTDIEDGTTEESHAFAREPQSKKGMDESQISGTASSYARKYALNGLFCIDDTKDPDTDEYKNEANNRYSTSPESVNPATIPNGNPVASSEQINIIKTELKRTGITQKFLMDSYEGKTKLSELTNAQAIAVINKLKKTPDKGA